jgi:glycosyltransferase involved in cell wall biosynthesis
MGPAKWSEVVMVFADQLPKPAQPDMARGNPLVSVVIASYNMGKFLPEAIRSVLNQSMPDLEVHVVDDGSTDDTMARVEEFFGDTRFHYHFQENSGQTAAKNAGLRFCRGTYVGFCDGDDMWPRDRLERQVPAMQANASLGVVYGQSIRIDESGKAAIGADLNPEMAPQSGMVTRALFQDNFVPFGAVLVRRQCLEQFGGFDESLRMGIDWDLWLRISTRYEFLYLPYPALYYRVWGGQMSSNWAGRYDHAFRIMSKFIRDNPGALSRSSIRNAYSMTFVGRARARAFHGRQHLAALADCLKALRWQPLNARAYRTMGRVLLSATGRRAP